MLVLAASPAFADDEEKEGETPQQKDERLASQAGHYAAGVRVQIASAGPDSFNFIGIEPGGRYNLTDAISVGARIPLVVKKPDGAAAFGGMMARAELRLGATIGAAIEGGFSKNGGALLSSQDAPVYADAADYAAAVVVGPWVRFKGGPTYLSFNPAFVYQAGDPKITGLQFPVTAMFRMSGVLQAGGQLGVYTGDDFKMGAKDGGRVALGALVNLNVSSITVQGAAGFSSLLTDDASPLYTSIGKAVYVTFGLIYRH